MDENVLAAMARWPNVPDVFGWLSLSERGQWRLHPQGDALAPPQTGLRGQQRSGEEIGSPAIKAFMNRNYTNDSHGRWYFQNGPQRVFVRLDAAPYILSTTGPDLALITHNDLAVTRISAWVLDDLGHLYAQTEHGPGLVAGRDLPALIDALRTDRHESLASALGHPDDLKPIAILKHPPSAQNHSLGQERSPMPNQGQSQTRSCPAEATPLQSCTADNIAAKLGFVRFPAPVPLDKT